MVTQFKALLLCGDRQLKLYDLDHGTLMLKLKGVMNQKMPWFAVIDEDSCAALSRNRMTVNIMSLQTGDLQTTFKVGEDRFLNSLLVSGNGAVCVCGDETQKPFPLLVWDLSARKLLYDLRLPHHTFLTQFSAISHDAHFVLSVALEISSSSSSSSASSSSACNFLVVYDLTQGILFKKWKPGKNTTAVLMVASSNVVSALEDGSILIWDLATGDLKHTLTRHTHTVDTLRCSSGAASSHLILSHDSTLKDQTIRLWHLETGRLLKAIEPSFLVSCCRLTASGRHVVMAQRDSLSVCSMPTGHGGDSEDGSSSSASFGEPSNEGKTFTPDN